MSDQKAEVSANEVRAWARRRGFPVGTRGHIHRSIVEEYNKAHRVRQFTNTNPAFRTVEPMSSATARFELSNG